MKRTSAFVPPCVVHFKNTKNVLYILKQPFQNQPKSVKGYVRKHALSPKVGQTMQLELSKCNTSAVFPHVERINSKIKI